MEGYDYWGNPISPFYFSDTRPTISPWDYNYCNHKPSSYYQRPTYSMQYSDPYSSMIGEDEDYYNYLSNRKLMAQRQRQQQQQQEMSTGSKERFRSDHKSINIPVQIMSTRQNNKGKSNVDSSEKVTHQCANDTNVEKVGREQPILQQVKPMLRKTDTDCHQDINSSESLLETDEESSRVGADQNSKSGPSGKNGEKEVFKIIEEVRRECDDLIDQIEKFEGSTKDKQYRYLDEMLTRCFIKLDNIEVQGREDVRQARKSVVQAVNKGIDLLESKIGDTTALHEDHVTVDPLIDVQSEASQIPLDAEQKINLDILEEVETENEELSSSSVEQDALREEIDIEDAPTQQANEQKSDALVGSGDVEFSDEDSNQNQQGSQESDLQADSEICLAGDVCMEENSERSTDPFKEDHNFDQSTPDASPIEEVRQSHVCIDKNITIPILEGLVEWSDYNFEVK